MLVDEAGNLKVQNDKVGKIGEYTFHLLLNNYFGLDCVLPKFRCTTDRNMSVFGYIKENTIFWRIKVL